MWLNKPSSAAASTSVVAGASVTVVLNDVVVTYGSVTALKGVSIRVPHRSITGLIGRNGAGKSTIVRLLAGLVRPDSGYCSILGLPPTEQPVELHRQAGYLLDTPALFSYLGPEETLQFLGEAYGLSVDAIDLRTEDLLHFFGLDSVRFRVVAGFSAGMQKRLALAAAMIHAPRVLVLDEPFESLDPLMVKRLKEMLVQYAAAGGTVLLSSHLIDAVEEICENFVILESGEVIASGAVRDAVNAAATRIDTGALEDLYTSVARPDSETSLTWLYPLGG